MIAGMGDALSIISAFASAATGAVQPVSRVRPTTLVANAIAAKPTSIQAVKTLSLASVARAANPLNIGTKSGIGGSGGGDLTQAAPGDFVQGPGSDDGSVAGLPRAAVIGGAALAVLVLGAVVVKIAKKKKKK